MIERKHLFLAILFIFVFNACNWAVQPEAPVYSGETIPLRVAVQLEDNVGNSYGEKVIESLRVWGVFEEIVYPHHSASADVDAVMTLRLNELDRSGAVTASNIVLGLGTLGFAGQGTDSKHRIEAELRAPDGWKKRYTVTVDSYFHRGTGMRDEQIAQRTRYLQTSKLAHQLALQFSTDRKAILQGIQERRPPPF